MGQISPESCTAAAMNFRETELTLGLPGEGRGPTKTGLKRGFSELGLSGPCKDTGSAAADSLENGVSGSGKLPGAKVQVVGWPPIRASRKNVRKICKYVKVAVDGAPYLRKVNLETYNGYEELLRAVEDLFSCFSISKRLDGWKIMDHVNGVEYVPTYEDREGDWMLIGDVPWKMFVESCKRLRLMKSSEAIGLAPRTPAKSTSSSC